MKKTRSTNLDESYTLNVQLTYVTLPWHRIIAGKKYIYANVVGKSGLQIHLESQNWILVTILIKFSHKNQFLLLNL